MIEDLDTPSSVLAVAFGGMIMRSGGTPPFEFFRMLEGSAPSKRIFVRDRHRSWYHRGVVGVAESIGGVRDALAGAIADSGVTRVVAFGASAGGYGALLFGCLLGVAEIHAFAPQTFVSPELRARHGDDRWEEQISDLMRSGGYRPAFGDLRGLLECDPAESTRVVIHFAEEHRLDAAHARRLESVAHVELRPHPGNSHAIANHMRENGEL